MKNKILFLFFSSLVSIAHSQNIDFKARAIVALSDADVVASSTIDGRLLKQSGLRDVLTTIALPVSERGQEVGTTTVSNSSVMGHSSLATSGDGRFAYVLETHSQFLDTTKIVSNIANILPIGNKMYIADISTVNKPRTRFAVPTGQYPSACDIFQHQMIIANQEFEKSLQLIEIDALGHPLRSLFSKTKFSKITNVSWHPNGEFIAVLHGQLLTLLKIKKDAIKNQIVDFERFGRPIAVGETPSTGSFTADGKYFLINDTKSPNTKSELLVLQLNTTDTIAQHKIVSKIGVGMHTQNFAISPKGNMVVAVSSLQSHLPWDNAQFSPNSLLSLFTLGSDGVLALANEQTFEGLMPKSVIFDQDGQNIAVSIFEYFDLGRRNGGIEFWRINQGIKPTLSKQSLKINVSRGCHIIRMIK